MADATTANPAMMGSAPIDADRVEPRRVVAFIIMVFGMFMSILDIQIVSASLSDIQAGLSASSTEVSWVQTAYLIAEVIAIPLSGFLSRALGIRLHRRESVVRLRIFFRRDDPVARDPGISRRRHDPHGVRDRLHRVPAL